MNIFYYSTNISVPRKVQELWVNIVFLDKNKRNETTFNWGPGMKIIFLGSTHRLNMSETTAVHMKRFLKSSLKGKDNEGKKVNLNKYLKVKLFFYL